MSKVEQDHHLFNKRQLAKLEDFTKKITRGEHQIVTLIQRYTQKEVSLALIQCLKIYMDLWEAGFVEIIDRETINESE